MPIALAYPDHVPPRSELEAHLAAYLAAKEASDAMTAQQYSTTLPSQELREGFLGAIQQLERAETTMPPPLASRTVLARRYELLEVLGSGGMGQVWRARDRKLGHEVAVKVLSRLARTALDVDRLVEREGKLLAKLAHPGVVRVQDAGLDGDHRFLVMELVVGLDLAAVIDALQAQRARGAVVRGGDVLVLVGQQAPGRTSVLNGDETWPVAATRIFVELLRTLEATHGVGVVHRDLKPGNIRIVAGGAPVLLDFGFGIDESKEHGSLTAALFGTAAYAAPEQWAGVDEVGPHTDIYQAGLVFYELLTLQRCFQASTPAEAMRAAREARYARPRELDASIDARLEACVLRAMDVDPKRRYRDAAAFRADLERLLAGEMPLAGKPLATVAARVRVLGRRHRLPLGLLAAACVGAFVVGLWSHAREPRLVMAGERRIAVQFAMPMRVLAFRVATGADGKRFVAPLKLGLADAGGARDFAVSLQEGPSELAAEDVGDTGKFAAGIVSTVFVSPEDEDAAVRFDRLVWVLRAAAREIDERGGAWLDAEKFTEMLEPGRGTPGVGVPAANYLQLGEWQVAGLQGVVLATGER